MNTDPDSFGLLEKLIAAASAIVIPVLGIRSYLDRRFSKKADKEDSDRCLAHIERLYANAEKDRALTRDLHDKAMTRIADNQTTLIEILTRK